MQVAACVCAGIALVLACSLAPGSQAQAVTAAEKQAEADMVYAQIDSLQTSLNEAMATYEAAQASYKKACESRDKASAQIETQNQRIDELQGELQQFAVGMYKKGGTGRFLDVIFEASTFNDFLTSWDACNSIALEGVNKIDEARAARAKLEKAQATYQKQSEKAEQDIAVAEEAKAQIEQTQEALRIEAQQLSQEAAELQIQEELEAEAARQAEEAARMREAEIAAAAQEAQEQSQAEAEDEDEDEYADEDEEDEWDDEEYSDEDEEDSDYDEDEEEDEYADEEEEDDYEQSSSGVLGPGYFTHPCPGASYSSGFGYRTFDNSFHMGLDMAASEGTPYYAADSGTVMYATNDGSYNGGAGNWVVISHGNGIVTKYMHSSATYVVPGEYVERGQNIGAVGNTGNSFGAHLHFQVEVNGVAVDPLNYL